MEDYKKIIDKEFFTISKDNLPYINHKIEQRCTTEMYNAFTDLQKTKLVDSLYRLDDLITQDHNNHELLFSAPTYLDPEWPNTAHKAGKILRQKYKEIELKYVDTLRVIDLCYKGVTLCRFIILSKKASEILKSKDSLLEDFVILKNLFKLTKANSYLLNVDVSNILTIISDTFHKNYKGNKIPIGMEYKSIPSSELQNKLISGIQGIEIWYYYVKEHIQTAIFKKPHIVFDSYLNQFDLPDNTNINTTFIYHEKDIPLKNITFKNFLRYRESSYLEDKKRYINIKKGQTFYDIKGYKVVSLTNCILDCLIEAILYQDTINKSYFVFGCELLLKIMALGSPVNENLKKVREYILYNPDNNYIPSNAANFTAFRLTVDSSNDVHFYNKSYMTDVAKKNISNIPPEVLVNNEFQEETIDVDSDLLNELNNDGQEMTQ